MGCYDRALAIEPRDAQAWNNKGSALYDLGRRAEAISATTRRWRSTRETRKAWYNKGNALDGSGGARRRWGVTTRR